MLSKRNTERGFPLMEFNDLYGVKCSLQKSSLVTEDAIWLGVSGAQPIILASQAKAHGVETAETTGWVPYPIPEEVFICTRMHLSREQVHELLPVLIKFSETGEI